MAYRTKKRTAAVATPVAPLQLLELNPRRGSAVIVQLASLAATYAFVAAIAGPVDPVTVGAVACAVEYVLVIGKRELLKGRADTIALACLIGDALLNAGGIWPLVKRLSETGTYKALAEATQLDPTIGAISGLIIALVAGLWLSMAPSQLWKED